MDELAFDIASLHRAYADGTRPAEVIAACYRRLGEADDPGIFISLLDEAAAIAEAEKLGAFEPDVLRTKPLWGVPFAVKDNIDVAGLPTTAACPAYAYEPAGDAFVVAQLRAAGAIPIGKTNLDQFATGLVGVRTPYPVPRNAIDPAIVPGGSSSGSAVAVARGIVSLALGTDTAGSGRVPAALNNIVGLKPTLGALSASGVVPACRTLDTISIFALTVDDAHAAFRAAAAFDPADAYARPIATPPIAPLPTRFRVGVPDAASREFFGDDAQAASFAATLDQIATLGGEVVELDFTPFFAIAAMLYEGAWVAERHAVIEDMLRERPEDVHPTTRAIIGGAVGMTATDAFRGFYRLQALRREADPLVASVDLICVPSIPTFYSRDDLDADPVTPNSRLGTYTNFVNLMDLAGIAVPVAPRPDGRPGGVTVLAAAQHDAQAAALGAALHRLAGVTLGATDWPLGPDTEAMAAGPQPDEIAVAAVGAHMSGLPLNGELTRLGARFLEATTTAPTYRLFRLAGGPPLRPGLVRAGDGAAIALEIWALPAAKFGAFMRGIPAPLGIGTVELASGDTVKGFICEPVGMVGAEDITRFGGWRAFLAAQNG